MISILYSHFKEISLPVNEAPEQAMETKRVPNIFPMHNH
jgi:hypothetical protein